MAPLPELLGKRAEKLLTQFCHRRVVSLAQPDVRLVWEVVTDGYQLVEVFSTEGQPQRQAIAQFRYQTELQQWCLYQRRESGWRFCTNVNPSLDLQRLLDFLDLDPFSQFWT